MREIKVKLYKFDELPTENAKDKARDWFRQFALEYDWWDFTYDDAKNVGLEITSFDVDRNRHAKGKFMASAEETAHKIEKDHGETCETFTTAKAYLKARDEIIDTAPRSELGDLDDSYVDEKLDVLDAEFLHDLLEYYSMMLQKEMEYLMSNESVDENIIANEYEFTEDGKRA